MTSPDEPVTHKHREPSREVERPEGDMVVGPTTIALGGKKNSDGSAAEAKAPVTGTGSVGDGKRPAAGSESNSGTSSTSVGTGTGGSG